MSTSVVISSVEFVLPQVITDLCYCMQRGHEVSNLGWKNTHGEGELTVTKTKEGEIKILMTGAKCLQANKQTLQCVITAVEGPGLSDYMKEMAQITGAANNNEVPEEVPPVEEEIKKPPITQGKPGRGRGTASSRKEVCENCGMHFYNLVSHQMKCMEKAKKKVCPHCNMAFVRIKAHLERVHGDIINEPQECKLCNKSFRNLASHMSKEHAKKEGGLYKCDQCGYSSKHNWYVKTHIRNVHQDTRNYKCSFCDKKFKNSAVLKQHENTIHKGIREFQCKECDKMFSKLYHLQVHERRHTGSRPYLCMYCGNKFCEKANLERHIQCIHLRVYSYKCPVEDCGSLFKLRKQITRHVELLHDNDPDILAQAEKRLTEPVAKPGEEPDKPNPKWEKMYNDRMKILEAQKKAEKPAVIGQPQSENQVNVYPKTADLLPEKSAKSEVPLPSAMGGVKYVIQHPDGKRLLISAMVNPTNQQSSASGNAEKRGPSAVTIVGNPDLIDSSVAQVITDLISSGSLFPDDVGLGEMIVEVNVDTNDAPEGVSLDEASAASVNPEENVPITDSVDVPVQMVDLGDGGMLQVEDGNSGVMQITTVIPDGSTVITADDVAGFQMPDENETAMDTNEESEVKEDAQKE